MTAGTAGPEADKRSGSKTQIAAVIGSGVIGGVDAIGFAVASATLFFAGSLASGIGMAAGVCILSSVILCLSVAWRSDIRGNVAQIQDMGVAVLTGTLATTAGQMQASADNRVATAFAIIALSSLATAMLLCVTGWLRAGRVVRYFPLEVLAGFMAGTGWLLATGSMATMTSGTLGLEGWFELRNLDMLMKFLPALVFGVVLYVAMTRLGHPATMLAVLCFGIAVFYVWLFATGGTIEGATAAGLLPAVNVETALQLPFPSQAELVDWNVVTLAIPAIVTIAILSLFATLMNTSALELISGHETRMDEELKTTGYANAGVALIGGAPGYSDLTVSSLAVRLGVRTRGAGFIMAAVLLLGFAFTGEIVGHIPVFVSGGFILYFGIDLMKNWLVDTYKRFSLREWGVVVLILVFVACYGFLVAIVAGFLIATILFAYSYANTPVVRNAMFLADLPSSTERTGAEAAYLSDTGNGVKILQLQGFLFFGTTEQVLAQIRPAIEQRSGPRLQSIIINFRRVTNIDSGSASAFQRVQTLAKRHGFHLILCGLSDAMGNTLMRAGMSFKEEDGVSVREDLDRALEFAENMLLAQRAAGASSLVTLTERFAENGQHAEKLARLFAAAERTAYAAGETIIHAGDDADVLHFLESGRAMIARKLANGELKRLRTMSSGAILGEMAFCLGVKRTADVIAEEPSIILSLAVAKLRELEHSEPDLAILLHRLISRALAEKVFVANRIIEYADGE